MKRGLVFISKVKRKQVILTLILISIFILTILPFISASIGDLNNDSKVYFSDVVIIVKWILNIERTNAASDVNSDGQVNIFDIVKVAVLLGKQYSADSTVPILSEGRPNINFSAGTTEAVVYVRTDERATCKYSSSSGTAFGSMTQFNKTGGIFHSRLATGLQNGGTYNYYVKCQDEAGNLNSTDYFITFSISGTDTSAPTQPSGLNATAASSTQINLTWNAATDNVAVTGYRIYRCQGTCTPSIAIANVTSGTSYNNIGLSSSTQYTYSVSAYDSRGNEGAKSTTDSATTQAADTTAPVRSSGSPSSNLSSGTTSTNISLTTNEAATCKYGTVSGIAYASIANTFAVTGSTSHSQLVTGLTNGTTYNYYVRCNDTAGNVNVNDYAISFGVNAAGGVSPVFSDDFETGDFTHISNGYKWKTPDGAPDVTAGTGGNGFFDRTAGTWAVNAHVGQVIYLQDAATNANGDIGLMGPYTITSNTATRLNFVGDATGARQTRAHKAFISTTLPFSGTKSVKFIFGPDLAGQDSRSELPFAFGANLSELWVEYWLYVPANYYHRTDPPSSNNKFALILTRDDGADGISDDTSRMLYDFEAGSNPDGTSQIFAQSIAATATSTDAVSSTSNTGYNGVNFVGGVGAAVLGQWNQMQMHVKAASGLGSADGVQELWANGILVFQKTNGNFGYPNIAGSNWYGTFPAVVNYGYVLGASNSGFAETTIFYVDNFKIYNTNPGW